MFAPFLTAMAAASLAQASPSLATSPAPITDLAQLPVTEATAPRCAIAFALVGQWQQAGEPRGQQFPNMQAGGAREFFVQAMAALMDAQRLDRNALLAVVARETEKLQAGGDEAIAAMMPACLSIKQAAGL